MGSDGSVVLVGNTDIDENNYAWSATKLDINGSFLWDWTGNIPTSYGTSETDSADVGSDGVLVMVGGNASQLVVVKIDRDGNFEWRNEDFALDPGGVSVLKDGSMVVAGGALKDPDSELYFTACKLDADGTIIWKWQNGSEGEDLARAIASTENQSVVLAGYTYGNWSGENHGWKDFAAVKLDVNGTEIWRWQDGTENEDEFKVAIAGDDGSVVLAGWTFGDWCRTSLGFADFAAIKLDANGSVIWRWQGGYAFGDRFFGGAMDLDGNIFLGGFTDGKWNDSNPGGNDFICVKLNLFDGSEITRWQEGTEKGDQVRAVGAGFDGLVVLAGYTTGSWSRENLGGADFFAVMVDLNPLETPAPATLKPSSSPTISPTQLSHSPEFLSSTPPQGQSIHSPSVASESPELIVSSNPTSYSPLERDIPTPMPVRASSVSSTGTTIIVICVTITGAALLLSLACAVLRRRRRARTKNAPSLRPVSPRNLPKNGSNGRKRKDGPPPSYDDAVHFSDVSTLHKQQRASPVRRGFRTTFGSNALDQQQNSVRVTPFGGTHGGQIPGQEMAVGSDLRPIASVDSFQGHMPSNYFSDSATGRYRAAPTALCHEGLAYDVMDAAQKVVESYSLPMAGKAARLVSTLVQLISKSTDNTEDIRRNLERCRSIMTVFQRAALVLDKGDEKTEEIGCSLLKDVHGAIEHLVDLIKTYKSKDELVEVKTPSIFHHDHAEAKQIIDSVLTRLQEIVASETSSPALSPEVKSLRRERLLNQIEIPGDQITITDRLLGKGGFGAVYIADFNGSMAAAKVITVEHNLRESDCEEDEAFKTTTRGHPSTPRKSKPSRKAFLGELEAMMRLRSPHTVNVYGIITTRKDRLVLVMELLPGGDLCEFLRHTKEKVPDERARQIIKDICAGILYLHSKKTVHGDLKSANILFDGAGRAKIADFGTSRWMQHTNATRLDTSTAVERNAPLSFAWAAPEVLNADMPTYASDVYSFGIVMWEILSGDTPWASIARPWGIMARVFNGHRPPILDHFPTDLAAITQTCWVNKPEDRPLAEEIMRRLKSPH